MKENNSHVKKIPDVIDGLKVEAWLRGAVMLSILSTRFLPNSNGEIATAADALEEKDRHRFLVRMTIAHSRVSAQADFMGVIGIPLAIGVITIVTAFDISVTSILFFFLILLGYLFIYFYYRLMKAAVESILDTLKIASEYW